MYVGGLDSCLHTEGCDFRHYHVASIVKPGLFAGAGKGYLYARDNVKIAVNNIKAVTSAIGETRSL